MVKCRMCLLTWVCLPPLAPAGRPSRLKRGYQRLCNKASTLNPWRKVVLGSVCTLLFMLFATFSSCNTCVMSCTDKPQSVLMQHISGVGCMQARSGLQSPHVPSCTPSSPSEDQEAQSTPSVVDTCSPSLVDLEAGSPSSMVDLSSPPLVDLESKSSSLVVDQDDAIPKNVGGAPVLGQNQAGQVRSHFDLRFYALVSQLCRA